MYGESHRVHYQVYVVSDLSHTFISTEQLCLRVGVGSKHTFRPNILSL